MGAITAFPQRRDLRDEGRGGRRARAAETETQAARRMAYAAARDWIATQACVIEYWRDLLVDAGAPDGEDALIAALDAHAAFLRAVGDG